MTVVGEPFVVKASLGGEIRRITFAGTSFQLLQEQVANLFGIEKDKQVVLKYKDNEGDLVTMSSDVELAEAVRWMENNMLRLEIGDKPTAPPMVGAFHPSTAPPFAPVLGHGVPAPVPPPVPIPAPPPNLYPAIPPHASPFGAHPHPHGPHPHPQGPPHIPPFAPAYFQQGFNPGFAPPFPHHHPHHGPGPHGPYGFRRREDFLKHMKKMKKEQWKQVKKGMSAEEKKAFYEQNKAEMKLWKKGRYGMEDDHKEGSKLVARHVKDVTVVDGTEFPPNTPFTKTWKIRNEGVAWPAGCRLMYISKKCGDMMGATEFVNLPTEGPVQPNEEIDLSVNLVSPSESGRYVGFWRLVTPEGKKFGQRFWTSIVVTGSSSDEGRERSCEKYEAKADRILASGYAVKKKNVMKLLMKCDGDEEKVMKILTKRGKALEK